MLAMDVLIDALPWVTIDRLLGSSAKSGSAA